MQRGRTLLTIIAILLITEYSQSQTKQSLGSPNNDFVGGSTACDAYIKSQLKIPASLKCDFMRWRVHMIKGKNGGGTFNLTISYGEAKPNTNGFIEEHKIEANGDFDTSTGLHKNPEAKLLHLHSSNFKSALLLAQIDQNVFQLTDNNKKFLVGNGGWSYSLYKIKE